ncbi:hypothetical protein, partial [Altererythrobacter sp.]|uniref:hypothetical protein n=1 Tax=Altererythrobacter sp. TaxID=1872480 RepID=UPI003D0CB81E
MLEILFDQNLMTAVIQWAMVGGAAGALIELAHWHVSHRFRFGNIDDDSYAPRGIPGAPDQEPEHTAARSLRAVASGAALAVWVVIMFRAPEDWRDEIELGVAALPLCALIIALLIRPRVKDV